MKCAAIPKSAPPNHIHTGGTNPFDIAIDEGNAAKATAYGNGDRTENLK